MYKLPKSKMRQRIDLLRVLDTVQRSESIEHTRFDQGIITLQDEIKCLHIVYQAMTTEDRPFDCELMIRVIMKTMISLDEELLMLLANERDAQ